MIGKVNSGKKYTGADLRQEAAKELYGEMEAFKKRPLTSMEKGRMDKLALLITKQVLDEMEKQ